MKAVLHIGIGKAGSSSIQKFFTDQRSQLSSSGICYPFDFVKGKLGGDNHKGLAMICTAFRKNHIFFRQQGISDEDGFNSFKTQLRAAYGRQFNDLSADSVVLLSAEHFWSELTHPDQLMELLSLFDELGLDIVRVIMHVRNQYDWLESFIHQKYRENSPVGAYSDLDSDWILTRLNYFDTFRTWQDVFVKARFSIRLVTPDKVFLYRKSLLVDFLASVFDIQPSLGTAGNPQIAPLIRNAREAEVRKSNVSTKSPVVLMLERKLRAAYPEILSSTDDLHQRIKDIIGASSYSDLIQSTFVDQDDLLDLYRLFSASNLLLVNSVADIGVTACCIPSIVHPVLSIINPIYKRAANSLLRSVLKSVVQQLRAVK